MPTPFEIRIFSVTGDPDGIRSISKTNWSGAAIAFPREAFGDLKTHEFIRTFLDRAGVYILVGDLAEQTIYIGEADPIKDRLKQHIKRTDWQWAVFFVDALNGLGKTEVQYLESELLKLAHKANTTIILNKKKATLPNMSPAGRAAVSVFLQELLSIVPLIGIKAFTKAKTNADVPNDIPPPATFDTIVVPAKEDGIKKVFLGKACWYAIKIQANNIPQIKYIAAYVTAPTSAITHVAEVKKIVQYENSNKYVVLFKQPAVKIGPIPLANGGISVVPRSSRYCLRERLTTAKKLAEVWKP